ncbi:MAG: hypothetical protein ACKOKC_11525, partial [Chthoniobacterales bacterium]
MSHQPLIDFARKRLSQGASLAEIQAHLREQKYGDDVVAEVLRAIEPATSEAAASTAAAVATPRPWLRWVAAALVVLILVGGYFALRHFGKAQAVRTLVKHVQFEGNIKGQVEGSDRTLNLVDFRGALDTSDLSSPKAAMKLELDEKGKTGKDLK